MPNSIKSFTQRRMDKVFLDEYFAEELASAEYGYMIYNPSSSVTKITLKVGRVGLAIGKRGQTIKKVSTSVKEILGHENVQIEVEGLDDPEIFPQVMAARLASSLERGRHFRRSAYGTMRRIMASGALGCQITVSGKITSQRARIENFKEGFVAKTGHPVELFVRKGYSKAKIKRGILGITVWIMLPDSVLPDHVDIIAEPTHTSREIIREDDEDFTDLDQDEEFTEFEEDFDEEEEFDDLESLEEVDAATDEDIPDEALAALEEDEEDLDLEIEEDEE
ncbi:MAG: 30S ribosomal protein S3 [Candidatus Kariarchaeaceae archaeon]